MSLNQETDELLTRAGRGDATAISALIDCHRERLKRLIAIRIDRRLSARVDPSDVVQEAMLDASLQCARYAQERPIPLYPWLRQIALARLAKIHRRHLNAKLRTVVREEEFKPFDRSSAVLASHLAATNQTASKIAVRNESLSQIEEAIGQLAEADREALVLRYVEQLPIKEAAAVLGITANTFAQRHVRAIARVRQLLKKDTQHG